MKQASTAKKRLTIVFKAKRTPYCARRRGGRQVGLQGGGWGTVNAHWARAGEAYPSIHVETHLIRSDERGVHEKYHARQVPILNELRTGVQETPVQAC